MIHPTAIIDETAQIAPDVQVGAYSIIEADVTIDSGTVIGPHVVISGPTKIGKNNHFYQFGSIGAAPQDKKYAGEPTRLTIGDNNTFRENVTINRGTIQDRGETTIGNDNWIMAGVHIAHDCIIGNHAIFANASALAGHVTVNDWAILGGYTLVHQFCHIGEHAFCGMGSVINQDVPNFVTVSGNLAGPRGLNIEGLKRRGFDKVQLNLVKKAYRALYRTGYRLEEAIQEIDAINDERKTLDSLLAFLKILIVALSDSVIPQQSSNKEPIFVLIAGEASGDLLGADLISALKHQYPNAKFVGIGGSKMCAQGLESWFPIEKLSVMGLFEVLKHLPELMAIRRFCIQQLMEIKPAAFIGIDAPDFNFKIEGAAKKAGIPAIHYVGPSVWAWREKRLIKIKQQVDGVLVLFPFELPYYQKYGIPAQYVGHPLATQVQKAPNQLDARKQIGIASDALVTALLPGSRMSEIELMTELYLQVAARIQVIYPAMVFLIPCVHAAARQRIEKAVADYGQDVNVMLLDQQAQLAMSASDQLLVTSGTATLEAALMKKPMILAMKVHPISYWIMKKLATTEWIGLPNILANKMIVPEFIQVDATVENIALALGKLMQDQKQRQSQLTAFDHQAIQLHQDTSKIAVDAIANWAKL